VNHKRNASFLNSTEREKVNGNFQELVLPAACLYDRDEFLYWNVQYFSKLLGVQSQALVLVLIECLG
jgi:hypothetical protein